MELTFADKSLFKIKTKLIAARICLRVTALEIESLMKLPCGGLYLIFSITIQDIKLPCGLLHHLLLRHHGADP